LRKGGTIAVSNSHQRENRKSTSLYAGNVITSGITRHAKYLISIQNNIRKMQTLLGRQYGQWA